MEGVRRGGYNKTEKSEIANAGRRWDDAQERGSNGGEGMRGTTRAALMACGNTDQRSRTGGWKKK